MTTVKSTSSTLLILCHTISELRLSIHLIFLFLILTAYQHTISWVSENRQFCYVSRTKLFIYTLLNENPKINQMGRVSECEIVFYFSTILNTETKISLIWLKTPQKNTSFWNLSKCAIIITLEKKTLLSWNAIKKAMESEWHTKTCKIYCESSKITNFNALIQTSSGKFDRSTRTEGQHTCLQRNSGIVLYNLFRRWNIFREDTGTESDSIWRAF